VNKEDLFDYADKWFVLMHESLYYEDQTLIGFRDQSEWESIFEDALVVYYQFGVQCLRGIFEVTEARRLINPNFGKEFNRNELQYQCRLRSIYDLNCPFNSYYAENLRFYKHIKNKTRWDNRRVFEINDKDLEYILSLT
jgi:hypothetical protein